MEIVLLPDADDDLDFWVKSGNKAILKKISELIRSIQETPFQGLGKPEGLKHTFRPVVKKNESGTSTGL